MGGIRRSDRGGAALQYAALLAIVAVMAGGLTTTDIGSRLVDYCVTAVCQAFGGQDCGEPEPPLAEEEPGDEEAEAPVDPPGPEIPARTPIDHPGCADPDAEWTEGLHAHNDYENTWALTDALDHGAVSVEADVFVGDEGDLWVRHDEHEVSRGTLRELYLDPLTERAEHNDGEIYPGRDRPFQLVVEIKEQSDVERCDAVEEGGDSRCEAYRRAFEQIRELPPGVEVVFSGGPPPADIVGAQPDNATFDIQPGPGCTLPDRVNIDSPDYDPEYARHFSMLNGEWGEDGCGDKDGDYDISEEEQEELNAVVDQAHRSGLRVRFWGGPDGDHRSPLGPGEFLPCMFWEDKCDGGNREEAWAAQLEAGVDFYNTNHLSQSSNWIRSCGEGF